MMLEGLGQAAAAAAITTAIKTTCAEKRKLTPDLGGRTTPEAAGPLWPLFLLTKGLHRGDLITYGLDDTA